MARNSLPCLENAQWGLLHTIQSFRKRVQSFSPLLHHHICVVLYVFVYPPTSCASVLTWYGESDNSEGTAGAKERQWPLVKLSQDVNLDPIQLGSTLTSHGTEEIFRGGFISRTL